MSDPRFVSARFTLTRAELTEGMGFADLPTTRGARLEQGLSYLIQLGLAPLGGILLYLFLRYGVDLPDTPFPVWPVLLIGAGVAFLVMTLGNRAAARVHDITLQGRFFTGNGAEVGEAGLVFLGPDSRWQTGWADIDGLSRGPTVIVARIGMMYVPIPRSAFGDAAASDAVWQAMTRWHGAARASAGLSG